MLQKLSIERAVSVLEIVLIKKKQDPRFRRKWLSDQAKDFFDRAEKAAEEGAMDRCKQLRIAFHKIARRDERNHVRDLVGGGNLGSD